MPTNDQLVEDDFVQTSDDVIRARLLHVLHIYQGISPSMLQVGIGTAISPKMWHPIMAKLKEEGLVKETEVMAQAPNGRDLTYKKLSLVMPAIATAPSDQDGQDGAEHNESPETQDSL